MFKKKKATVDSTESLEQQFHNIVLATAGELYVRTLYSKKDCVKKAHSVVKKTDKFKSQFKSEKLSPELKRRLVPLVKKAAENFAQNLRGERNGHNQAENQIADAGLRAHYAGVSAKHQVRSMEIGKILGFYEFKKNIPIFVFAIVSFFFCLILSFF